MKARDELGRSQTLALTATATPQVQEELCQCLGIEGATRIVKGFNRQNLSLEVKAFYAGRYLGEKTWYLKSRLEAVQETPGTCIVYMGSVKALEGLVPVVKSGWGLRRVESYHGQMGSAQQRLVQQKFQAGEIQVLFATNAFGMGIDYPHVREVIHYHVPSSLDMYYQEAGRAGRDGEAARCEILWEDQERLRWFFWEKSMPEAGVYQTVLSRLHEMSGMIRRERPSVVGQGVRGHERLAIRLLVKIGVLEEEQSGAEWRYRPIVVRLTEAHHGLLAKEEQMLRMRRSTLIEGMERYMESSTCRRQVILEYFGDAERVAHKGKCCDICDARRTRRSA